MLTFVTGEHVHYCNVGDLLVWIKSNNVMYYGLKELVNKTFIFISRGISAGTIENPHAILPNGTEFT